MSCRSFQDTTIRAHPEPEVNRVQRGHLPRPDPAGRILPCGLSSAVFPHPGCRHFKGLRAHQFHSNVTRLDFRSRPSVLIPPSPMWVYGRRPRRLIGGTGDGHIADSCRACGRLHLGRCRSGNGNHGFCWYDLFNGLSPAVEYLAARIASSAPDCVPCTGI